MFHHSSCHCAHEAVQNGHLRLVRVNTSKQLADIFTKRLHPQPWATCIKSILLGRKWEISQGTSILTSAHKESSGGDIFHVESRRP